MTDLEGCTAWPVDPEPEGPTDEELDELFTEIDQSGKSESWRDYARAVLSRWGTPNLVETRSSLGEVTPPAALPGA